MDVVPTRAVENGSRYNMPAPFAWLRSCWRRLQICPWRLSLLCSALTMSPSFGACWLTGKVLIKKPHPCLGSCSQQAWVSHRREAALPPPTMCSCYLCFFFFFSPPQTASLGETTSWNPGIGSVWSLSSIVPEELRWDSSPEKSNLNYFQAFLLLMENYFILKSPGKETRKKKFFFFPRWKELANSITTIMRIAIKSSSSGKLCSLKHEVKEEQGSVFLATTVLHNPPSSTCEQPWERAFISSSWNGQQ